MTSVEMNRRKSVKKKQCESRISRRDFRCKRQPAKELPSQNVSGFGP